MWVPIVPTNVVGSIAWPCHFGTVLLIHKDWNSRDENQKAWNSRHFQSKYEWCRASNKSIHDQAMVLCAPLLRFESDLERNNFMMGRTLKWGQKPYSGSKALMPTPPYLLQTGVTMAPRFAKDIRALTDETEVNSLEQLYNRCMDGWAQYSKRGHGLLAGLLSSHEGPKSYKRGQGQRGGTRLVQEDGNTDSFREDGLHDNSSINTAKRTRTRLPRGHRTVQSLSGHGHAERLFYNNTSDDTDAEDNSMYSNDNDNAQSFKDGHSDTNRIEYTPAALPQRLTIDESTDVATRFRSLAVRKEAQQVTLRQTQISFPNLLNSRGQYLWPERNLGKHYMAEIKTWLIDVMGYSKAARTWRWPKVEKAARRNKELKAIGTNLPAATQAER
jgi:hypothetical protein